MNVFALAAFECPQIRAGRAGLDTGQHHASLALGTTGPLDRDKRRLRGIGLRHVMLPLDQAGAQHSRSPVEAEGGAVMVGTKFPLCPGVDINRISLCETFVQCLFGVEAV